MQVSEAIPKICGTTLIILRPACNIFTDICFATLPVPLIWSLQLQRRVRLYLIVILSGGYW